jgi:nucleoid DNA-binding protein
MIQYGLNSIIKKLAEKYKISEREVEKIVNSEFQMVAEEMKKGEGSDIPSYENIMLHHFGTFHILPKRIEKKYNKNKL